MVFAFDIIYISYHKLILLLIIVILKLNCNNINRMCDLVTEKTRNFTYNNSMGEYK